MLKGDFDFIGGEQMGLRRLNEYLSGGDKPVSHYIDTRKKLSGPDYSSKLSPWISNGCLSVRHVYHKIEKVKNESGLMALSCEKLLKKLLMRDFYKFWHMNNGRMAFAKYGIANNPNYVM